MSDARASALAVVQRVLDEQPELLIALQYCGMLVPDALAPLREESAQLVDRILSVPPAPEPAYARRPRPPRVTTLVDVGIRPSGAESRFIEQLTYQETARALAARNRSPINPETGRTLFAMWMENEIDWSPAVMGWADE